MTAEQIPDSSFYKQPVSYVTGSRPHVSQRPISRSSRSSRGPTSGRSIRATEPDLHRILEITKLEKTYTSPTTPLGIALPIDGKECTKRTQALALATLHQKGTHTSQFIQQIQGEQNGVDGKKISEILWMGRKWDSMLCMFDSIVRHLGKEQSAFEPFKPHGLMVLLKAGYHWYRAKDEHRRVALLNLCLTTNLPQQAKYHGETVFKFFKDIQSRFSFVPPNPASLSPVSLVPVSPAHPHRWKVGSEATVCKVHPSLMLDDSKLLLVLVSMFSNSHFSLDFLFLGATPRKRWTEEGQIAQVACPSLPPVLMDFLSDVSRSRRAADELARASLVAKSSDDTFALNVATRACILSSLTPKLRRFWRQQAFLITCRAVPWKFLESTPARLPELLLPHLKHSLHAIQEHEEFQSIPDAVRKDICLTLLEASRFPGRQWKQHAVTCAKEVMRGLDDGYVHACIAQRESLLYRTGGSLAKAVQTIDDISKTQRQHQSVVNPRMHILAGNTAIQRALNFYQNEELAASIQVLDTWQPLHHTPAEEVVAFRIDVIRGRILRYQGQFHESLACLERHATDQCGDLVFDEDLPDLICELADASRELGHPSRAEHDLRKQLTREVSAPPSTISRLKLCLAESLYAQEHYLESQELCSDVLSLQGVTKMGRLRLYITLAKLRYVASDWDAAFEHWTKALDAINKFPPTSGLATHIIHLSISDILHRQGHGELEKKSQRATSLLEQLCEKSEAKYWIAGLRHWLAFLERRDA